MAEVTWNKKDGIKTVLETEEHETIYLEPVCPDCGPTNPDEGRIWCQDDVWGRNCGGCGKEKPEAPRYELQK